MKIGRAYLKTTRTTIGRLELLELKRLELLLLEKDVPASSEDGFME